MAVKLGGGIILYKSVPWAKRGKALFSLKRQSFQSGAIPSHLTPYVEKFINAVASCKGQAKGTGAEKVESFNACISSILKGGGVKVVARKR